FDPAKASQWKFLLLIVAPLLSNGTKKWCFNGAWRNRINQNIVLGQLQCHGFGHANNTGLGGNIVRQADGTLDSCLRRDVDNAPAASVEHVRHSVAGGYKDAREVNADGPVKGLCGQLQEILLVQNTSGGHQDVDAAKFTSYLIHHLFSRSGISDIECPGFR